MCKTYGISRATLYRWLKRYDPKDLNTLRNKSRRPKRLRKPMWTYELIQKVKELREQYPRWGKEKQCILLRDRGFESSASTVGRIIGYLKRRGELAEPVRRSKAGRRRARRPYAIRKPMDWAVLEPGDLVQIDTLDVRPLPGVALKQFTARDLISKWDVVEARTRASSHTAKEFIDTVLRQMPFKVKAIQVDGGSEFYSEFERECECRAIRLFVLPPRSPKLNGCVERAQRTHREEFYDITDVSWTVPELNKELRQWEYVYNCVRPHQALGYKTPLQFLRDNGIIDKYQNPLFVSYVVNLHKIARRFNSL